MRIRSIKPVFWRDRELARVGDEARLFYIGLWMQADDAGYFRWNMDEIGADLYPFLGERSRAKKIGRATAALEAMPGRPRLEILPCGHARLSRFLDHQRAGGGSKITTFAAQHERCPRQVRTSPDKYGHVSTDGIGRDGTKDGTGLVRESGSVDPEEAWKETGRQLKALSH